MQVITMKPPRIGSESCDLRSTTMSWSLALPRISATISVSAQNPM